MDYTIDGYSPVSAAFFTALVLLGPIFSLKLFVAGELPPLACSLSLSHWKGADGRASSSQASERERARERASERASASEWRERRREGGREGKEREG